VKISMPANHDCVYISPYLVDDILTLQNSKYSSINITVDMKISITTCVSILQKT
jgi:hypothetical protein